MAYLDWHVGMKVVCVKRGQWSSFSSLESDPIYGSVYTIRTIHLNRRGEVFLRFNELVNPPRSLVGEAAYWARHFRPVQTRKSDISIFTAMLHDQRQKVPA